jgi:amino acid permease
MGYTFLLILYIVVMVFVYVCYTKEVKEAMKNVKRD